MKRTYLAAFYKENGLLLTANFCAMAAHRRLHNFFLRRRISGRPRIRVHPSAFIRGLSHIRIGDGFSSGRGFWLEAVTADGDTVFEPSITIGENVIINDDVHIAATNNVTIGDNVLMASRIFISDHNHGSYSGERQCSADTPPRLRQTTADSHVVIGDNVWLGEMVSVLPGVTIGRGSVIGAGSVVTRSLPPYSIATGSPAKVIRRFSAEDERWA